MTDYRLKISQKQLATHAALCERYGEEITFPDGYVIVPEREAQSIGATYGKNERRSGIYICTLPDGSCHS